MMLDTNALSALADGDTALAAVLAETVRLAVPVIALGEYRFGIRGSRHRRAYERWLEAHLALFTVLEVDEATTASYAEVRALLKERGHPIPENDVWIAALARQHEQPVVSRDRHFAVVPGLKLVAW